MILRLPNGRSKVETVFMFRTDYLVRIHTYVHTLADLRNVGARERASALLRKSSTSVLATVHGRSSFTLKHILFFAENWVWFGEGSLR